MKTALLAALLFAVPALAQTTKPSPAAPSAKKTVIEFEGSEILCTDVGPEDTVITTKPTAKFGSLIKVRTDFADKLMASVNEL